jgi:hypothetical protein
MRLTAGFAIVLLIGAIASGDDTESVLLKEPRAWRGVIEVESRRHPAQKGGSEEIQTERAEFIALTDPKATVGARGQLKLRLRRGTARWTLKINQKETKRGRQVTTRGAGAGDLPVSLSGSLDVATGRIELRTSTSSQRLVANTTLSGSDDVGFNTYRSVATRSPFLGSLKESGKLDADQRSAKGERTFDLKTGRFPRRVTVRWSFARLDPEVRGTIVDHNGKPIAGLKVIARTMAPAGPGTEAYLKMREGVTDRAGRFAIPAELGSWGVAVVPRVEKGLLTSGWSKTDAALLRFDEVPELSITLTRYELARLPRAHQLAGSFRGDVQRYLTYIKKRYPARRLSLAAVKP